MGTLTHRETHKGRVLQTLWGGCRWLHRRKVLPMSALCASVSVRVGGPSGGGCALVELVERVVATMCTLHCYLMF